MSPRFGGIPTASLAVVVDTPGELVLEVECSVSRPRCPHCGLRCWGVHDTRRRKIRDLEVSGRATTLVWMRRRFSCGNCGERFLEDHCEFEGRLTRRLARRLVADAKVMTVAAAARRHKLSWHVVMALVRSWADLVAEHRRGRRYSRTRITSESIEALLDRDHAPPALWLQWRAGQLPGQTRRRERRHRRQHLTSMEGRAIARPNATVTSRTRGADWTFNGDLRVNVGCGVAGTGRLVMLSTGLGPRSWRRW